MRATLGSVVMVMDGLRMGVGDTDALILWPEAVTAPRSQLPKPDSDATKRP